MSEPNADTGDAKQGDVERQHGTFHDLDADTWTAGCWCGWSQMSLSKKGAEQSLVMHEFGGCHWRRPASMTHYEPCDHGRAWWCVVDNTFCTTGCDNACGRPVVFVADGKEDEVRARYARSDKGSSGDDE